MSHELKNLLLNKGVNHKTTIPYQPQGNKSERYRRNLKAMLKIYALDKQNKWDAELSELNLALNSNFNKSTGYSAFHLMFAHDKNDPLTNKWHFNDLVKNKMTTEEILQTFKKAVENVKRGITKNQRKSAYQQKPDQQFKLEVGREVYIRLQVSQIYNRGSRRSYTTSMKATIRS